MIQERLLSFINTIRSWGNGSPEVTITLPDSFADTKLPGKPSQCFLFSRACNIDEMESADDEKYIFSTPDYTVSKTLDRFQTRVLLSQFNENFSTEKIDLIIKMAWNFPKLAINRDTAEFEPYMDKNSNLPPIINAYGPPLKKVYLDR